MEHGTATAPRPWKCPGALTATAKELRRDSSEIKRPRGVSGEQLLICGCGRSPNSEQLLWAELRVPWGAGTGTLLQGQPELL